jgi:flagellar motor component MotA
MLYPIARSFEIMRLTPQQIFALETDEKNRGRCFMPHEIQMIFHLPELKVTFCIPEIETAQATHIQRIVGDFYRGHLFPKYEKMGALDVETVHAFDDDLMKAGIEFVYSGGSKRRLRDQLDDETPYSKAEKAIKNSALLIPLALTLCELWKK